MRTIEEIERDLGAAEDRLKELEHEKRVAEEDARMPRKGVIRRRYELIKKMLDQLDELGEGVGDIEGCALHIKGATFEIHPASGVRECER